MLIRFLLVALLGWHAPIGLASVTVAVEGLMPGMAVLRINGQRRILKNGQSEGSVTLIAADAKQAELEIEGVRRVLGLSAQISTSYEAPAERRVTVARNARNQYLTQAEINGRRIEVLIDTGANVVAMNRAHAAALGIDLSSGERGTVETAGNVVPATVVMLRSVDVGGIRVENVRASVIDSDYPSNILLGMTYLQHVQIEERNGVLSLVRAW